MLKGDQLGAHKLDYQNFLNELKLSLMFYAFADNNKEFLEENLGYIKQTYEKCNAIKEEFLSIFQTIIDICHYKLLLKYPETTSNSEHEIQNIANEIAKDDELSFHLEIIKQNIDQGKSIVTADARNYIDPSICDSEKNLEEISEIEVNDATIQQETLPPERDVKEYLNHWEIINQYYQDSKKAQSFNKETYHVWKISDKVSYTTKSECVYKISKKHNNLYSMIDPKEFGSLEKIHQDECINALKNGIVTDDSYGVKILKKYFPELKIPKDIRLCTNKIYKNEDGGIFSSKLDSSDNFIENLKWYPSTDFSVDEHLSTIGESDDVIDFNP